MADDKKPDLRERLLAARVYLAQAGSRARRANAALEKITRRLDLLRAQNDLAIHSLWSATQQADGILHEIDAMLEAERHRNN